MEQSVATPPTAAALSRWTKQSSRRHATRGEMPAAPLTRERVHSPKVTLDPGDIQSSGAAPDRRRRRADRDLDRDQLVVLAIFFWALRVGLPADRIEQLVRGGAGNEEPVGAV